MINLFQQRDFGDKINATFQYVTQNFRTLALALLYIVGPIALAAGIATGIMQSNLLNIGKRFSQPGPADSSDYFGILQSVFSPSFWLSILFTLLAVLAVSLVTYAHMKLYERYRNQSAAAPAITVAEVWAEVQPVIGRAIVIGLLGSIVTGIAALFLVIPGIYVGNVLSLALVVTSFEGTDFGATWNRCFQLIRDKWWSTFGLILVMSIIAGIVGLIFTLPAGIINFMISAKLLPDISGFWIILGNVISTVGGSLLRSLVYVALGFQYANLVERQEGRGLLSAIDAIGTVPTQPRTQDEGEY